MKGRLWGEGCLWMINQILNQKMQSSINKESLSSINKISLEMDRLSSIIYKEQRLHHQLQSMLRAQEEHSNESSERFDEYFKQYDNPTTKSLPIDEESHVSQQNEANISQPHDSRLEQDEQDTQIMNTIYRNKLAQESEEEDRIHDDKSTVILNANSRKEREHDHPSKSTVNNYTSLNQDNRPKKERNKKTNKNPTSSIPPEIVPPRLASLKNASVSKVAGKTDSPMGMGKGRKEEEPMFMKELKGKLSKVSKIDKEELTRLQERKANKKTELSSNRKKTKRELVNTKSTAAMAHTYKSSQTNILKNYNTSYKTLQRKKESVGKRVEQRGISGHDWQGQTKVDRGGAKKLNRVNICKLQQNIKKNHQKKSQLKDSLPRKPTLDKNRKNNQRKQLKLHFTQNDQTAMKRLIDEKDLGREYTRQTDKYEQGVKRISKGYFEVLIRECRETSEEAVFKLKLVTLLLYFFDQFATSSLLPNTDNLSCVPQEQIIDILLHPKRVLRLMQDLPNVLMSDNRLSAQRVSTLQKQFEEVSEQLDQELQLFLIKKTPLFIYIHILNEYVGFLCMKQLVVHTKRTKLQPQNDQKLHGYYSSRSKREEISRKYIKKTDKANKFGFRCDSDRKITLQDEQAFLKGVLNCPQRSNNPLKKSCK